MLRLIKLVAVFVVLALGIAIAFYNATAVTVNYLFGHIELSLVVVMVGAMLFGFLLALILCASHNLAARREARRLRKRLRDAETELKNLRNLPLRDG